MSSIVRRFACIGASILALQLAGCASIVGGTNQSVSVDTKAADGQNLAGATCKLSNNKGSWFVTTPGSTVVNRSMQNLAVLCEKENHQPGHASAKSTTKAMAFGNILFGGVIGVGVDISTGAAFDYPTLISVTMGQSSVAAPALPVSTSASATNPTSTACSQGAVPCPASR